MSFNAAQNLWVGITSRLNSAGQWIPPFLIRAIFILGVLRSRHPKDER